MKICWLFIDWFETCVSGNIDADPYRVFLLSNLSSGNNLEALGLYTLLKGDVNPKSIDPLLALFYSKLTGNQLSPLELYALLTLGIGRVNSSSNYAKSFIVVSVHSIVPHIS